LPRFLIYFLRIALSNLAQNLFISLVSIATLGLALLILAGFLLISTNVKALLTASAQHLSVAVYLEDGLGPEAIAALKARLLKLPEAAEVVHITKAQAMSDLRRRLGARAALLDGLEENPLPASFELTLKAPYRSAEQIKPLLVRLKGLEHVTDVDYAWDWSEKLASIFNFFKLGALVIGGLLFLATVFIISNTIKLTVYARQEELSILRLIGATESFIRAPFLIEGLLQGFFGGLLALGLLWLMFRLVISQVEFPLGLSLAEWRFLSSAEAFGLVGLGLLLGLLGSLVSLGRFMRS
jgi:cell division transport system permease protein